MLFFIEGPDNTGKTTLARLLQESFSLDYIHCSKPKTNFPFLEYKKVFNELSNPTVFDRGHLGEFVYSQLWRGGLSILPSEYNELESIVLRKFDYVRVIHAQAPNDVILERCIRENEKLLKPEQIKDCSDLFYKVMDITKIPVINYYADKQSPEDILNQICKNK